MSDEIKNMTVTFSSTLHLSPQQVEALRAVGRERNTFTDWEGRYASLPDLRMIGLAHCVLGFWRLTTVGVQAHREMFGFEPA